MIYKFSTNLNSEACLFQDMLNGGGNKALLSRKMKRPCLLSVLETRNLRSFSPGCPVGIQLRSVVSFTADYLYDRFDDTFSYTLSATKCVWKHRKDKCRPPPAGSPHPHETSVDSSDGTTRSFTHSNYRPRGVSVCSVLKVEQNSRNLEEL